MRDKAEVINETTTQVVGGSVQKAEKKTRKIGTDKIWHFLVCLAIAHVVSLGLYTCGLGTSASGVTGFFVALIAGILKECWDVKRAWEWSAFSWKDILSDVIGAVFGSASWLLIMLKSFDMDEFLRFAFGESLLIIAIGVISFPFVMVWAERKSLKK